MHIHILGICGTFMGGLAVLAKAAGHRVTGCDAQVYPPMSTQLQSLGIELVEGYGAEQVGLSPDVFVIGNVVSRGNPLMEAILDQGHAFVSGPEWLEQHILPSCRVIAVAGTHGKTTTSSLVSWLLEAAGLEPGFLIGGVPANFGVSARLPRGWVKTGVAREQRPWFVIEADEYDTAFFDKRSKFVHYHPEILLLNNLEYDHADIFCDLEAIMTQFHHLVRTVPSSGMIVFNAQEANLKTVLARGCWTPQVSFGRGANWSLSETDGMGQLTLLEGEKVQGETHHWPLLGEHNRMNALGAVLVAQHAGVPVAVGMRALERFSGVRRRLEIKGVVRGITVYDDFAHHPTAIATTLAGLRQGMTSQQHLHVLLEPRSNTMKMGVWSSQLAQSLELADRVYGYSFQLGWDLKATLQSLGARAQVFEQLPSLVHAVAHEAHSGDVVVAMSNGSFGGVHEALLTALRERS
ncbi:MAG: UDP-N-acetylmuramate:L-alanyl-gamma-D-glutamyl-meso-diaminopimelate ligase [Ferrovum sp.]|nr:UDP-N-acetylmuramate:L-alanyl-gamma-D-glutamyl-meso-diaminopimelate ligase [Ferrovum sp.]NDU87398.1 UDP-N-acetylmuramate:L-alanyl-gamma-D-glutamyl-meso-diaminopimelate ligase [Ferrovum sp.]